MKKILVIEDEPEMRRNLLTILKLEKFQTAGAANGRDGLDAVKREKPDLILCDVMMPELDGHGVLDALRKSEDTVPNGTRSRWARVSLERASRLGAARSTPSRAR